MPQATLGSVQQHFSLSQLGEEGMLLASTQKRSGMLLNILKYTVHFPTTKNYLVPNINSAAIKQP